MNKERILALADLIEQQPHTSVGDEHGFNMSDLTHVCGTPCCIAGWAAWEAKGRNAELSDLLSSEVEEIATDFLDLEKEQREELFYMWDSNASLCAVTPQQAAVALRNLAESGNVDWAVALSSSNRGEQG